MLFAQRGCLFVPGKKPFQGQLAMETVNRVLTGFSLYNPHPCLILPSWVISGFKQTNQQEMYVKCATPSRGSRNASLV